MISEDEFWISWGLIQSSDEGLFDLKDVKDCSINHVWTIVESGDDVDDSWYGIPGIHYVNRLGYVITKMAWKDGAVDAVYFLRNE